MIFLPITCEDHKIQNSYVIQLQGILENGQKLLVNLHDEITYFDVYITQDKKEIVEDLILQNISKIKNVDTIKKFKVRGYSESKKEFLRIFFNNHIDRRNILQQFIEHKIQTFSDDLYNYFRKVAAEKKLFITQWNELTNYKIRNGVITMSINDFKLSEKQPNVDNILIYAFNIETWSGREQGDMPQGYNIEDEVSIFIIHGIS